MRLFKFFLLLIVSTSSFGDAPECSDPVSQLASQQREFPFMRIRTTKNTDDSYRVIDTAHTNFWIFAELKDGILECSFSVKLKDGTRSALDVKEEWAYILKKFEGKIKAIRSIWTRMDNDHPMSDYLKEFNSLTETLPPDLSWDELKPALESAAQYSRSGTAARKAGFNKAAIDTVEGTPGNFTHVVVYFYP